MYLGDNTLSNLRFFLDGLLLVLAAQAGEDTAEIRQMRRFNTYIRTLHGVTGWQDWDRVIDFHARNDAVALTDFFAHWNAFIAGGGESLPETRLHVDTCIPKLHAALAASKGAGLEALLKAVEDDTDTFLRMPSLRELAALVDGFIFVLDDLTDVPDTADWRLHQAFRGWVLARYDSSNTTCSWDDVLAQHFGQAGPYATAKFFEHWHAFMATQRAAARLGHIP